MGIDPDLVKEIMTETGGRLALTNGTHTQEMMRKYPGKVVTFATVIIVLGEDKKQGAHVQACGLAIDPEAPRDVIGELLIQRGYDMLNGNIGALAEIHVAVPNPRYRGNDAG